jgi:hypothetical protein
VSALVANAAIAAALYYTAKTERDLVARRFFRLGAHINAAIAGVDILLLVALAVVS